MVRAVVVASLALVLLAAPAPADRVVLKNGSVFRGRIVSEDRTEVELELQDGMRIRLRRSRIESVEIEEERAPEPTGQAPARPPKQEPAPEPAPGPLAPAALDPQLFATNVEGDWFRRYGRHPVLTVAKTTPFRSYEYAEHAALDTRKADPDLLGIVREHGHGGFLARWEFAYNGMRDLLYGDQVKFVAEITGPDAPPPPPLIQLRQGPEPITSRVVVILVSRGGEIRRHVTPSTFESRDFRQADVNAIAAMAMPVRLYDAEFRLLKTSWLPPERGEFLGELASPFGESVADRLERFRFRVRWLSTSPAERPALDPELVARDVAEPLAEAGRPAATEEAVVRAWGSLEANVRRLEDLREEVAANLADIGARPGSDYCVEQERIGVFGLAGLTIRTRRYYLSRELLRDLTR